MISLYPVINDFFEICLIVANGSIKIATHNLESSCLCKFLLLLLAKLSVISAHFILSLLFLICRSQRKCISHTQLELDLLYSLCDIPFFPILLSVFLCIVISLTECSCFPFSKHVYFLVWLSFWGTKERRRSGQEEALTVAFPSTAVSLRNGDYARHIPIPFMARGALRLRGLFRAYSENMILSYCGRFGHV